MEAPCQDHNKHDPIKAPVPGCIMCDRIVKRPVRRCFGLGASSTVIPPPKEERPIQDT